MSTTVELRELEVFLTLAEELHFGRTAERLGLSSSRVSQVLRNLERKVGGQLVYRTSRRVELTSLGRRFRDETRAAYEQVTGAVERTRRAVRGRRETLRLGLFVDPGVALIPRIVRAFEQAHPECVVEADEVPLDDLFGPLHRGEWDLVASWLPHGQSGLVTSPILSSEPRVLAVSSEHDLTERPAISVENIADYDVMRMDSLPKEFQEVLAPSKTPAGRPIRDRPFSQQATGDRGRMTNELLFMIATGRVVWPTVPSFAHMFGHPDIVYVPITDLPPLRSALVWRRGLTDPTAREFIRIAREVVRSRRRG